MDVKIKNELLLKGRLSEEGLFPHLADLAKCPIQFEPEIGLSDLPKAGGILSIRGPRQIGKSTWLEYQIQRTIQAFGPATAFYLNGDDIADQESLKRRINELISLFPKEAPVKRVFIDEITSIPQWETALKRLYDEGESRECLIVTTGSKAIDILRGVERLPGRKGKLPRTEFIFTQLPYREFYDKCYPHFREDVIPAYIVCGGHPLAANELVQTGKIPEYVVTMIRDWILGECAAQDRSRNLMTWLAQSLIRYGGNPVSQAKLAREVGAANNSVIQGYIRVLMDLLCVTTALQIDTNTRRPVPRKEHKYHWCNLLAMIAFHPQEIRSIEDFKSLEKSESAKLLEWLVASELWRQNAVSGNSAPELQFFWQSKTHELDFFDPPHRFIEVKMGGANVTDFLWFNHQFSPQDRLQVVSSSHFESSRIIGNTFEEFLLSK
ncbi:MAG: ATP-binding protein [Deltaproteobacteria bacterium]|nr:ATP-binding protein [Deltaproteobacteria bacterium]